MHLGHVSLLVINVIRHVRHSSDDIHIELAVQTLLHNLHMKQSQEPATETKTQRQ